MRTLVRNGQVFDTVSRSTSSSARPRAARIASSPLAPGAHADLVVSRVDPLRDISALALPEKHLALVMKAGESVH
jgi:hypothetical protein